MKKITAIYKITSPSGRVYIGQSWNIKARWNAHGNQYTNPQLRASFNKYGKKAHRFEIIHELPYDTDQDTLTRFEQVYIDAYRDCGVSIMNLREAGSVGKMSLESKQRMSLSRKGHKVSEVTRKKISVAHIGKKKPKTKEHIEKVTKLLIGKKRTPEMIEKTASKKRGQKLNDEQKKRLSDSHKGIPTWNKGKKMSAEFRVKCRARSIGKRLNKESVRKREQTKRDNRKARQYNSRQLIMEI